jgi:hypothetical protein
VRVLRMRMGQPVVMLVLVVVGVKVLVCVAVPGLMMVVMIV